MEASSPGRIIKCKGKTMLWPWNIECGLCGNKTMIRFDAKNAGRVQYFKKREC